MDRSNYYERFVNHSSQDITDIESALDLLFLPDVVVDTQVDDEEQTITYIISDRETADPVYVSDESEDEEAYRANYGRNSEYKGLLTEWLNNQPRLQQGVVDQPPEITRQDVDFPEVIEGVAATDFPETDVHDVFIPPMDDAEEDLVVDILQRKREHYDERDGDARFAPRLVVLSGFTQPDGDDFSYYNVEGRTIPSLVMTPDQAFVESDREFFTLLKTIPLIRDVFTYQTAFDEAIVEIEVAFNPAMVKDSYLYFNASTIANVLSTIVYRFIGLYYRRNPKHTLTREFKVQVGFHAVFKKLKKDVTIKAGQVTGGFDFLTFYKESMLNKDGVTLRFNTAEKAFKVTYNTTIEVINNCLDARNVPNMDSVWRYELLRTANIKLYCYECVVAMGKITIPPCIANKKACINPESTSGCFWWSVKLGLICNRTKKTDYSKTRKEIRGERHEQEKEFTKLQRISNIEGACMQLGIVHISNHGGVEQRTEVFPGVKESFFLQQGDLPDDMPCADRIFDKFCFLNPHIMLNVYKPSGSKNVPIQLVYEGNNSLVNENIKILFLEGEEEGSPGHYVCIKNFNKFLFNIDKCKGHKKIWCDQCKAYKLESSKLCPHLRMKRDFENTEVFCCEKCMSSFQSKEDLNKHNQMCLIVDKNYRVVELPEERTFLEFKSEKTNNLTPLPSFIVADFESILEPVHEEDTGNTKSHVTANHLPCAYGIKVVSIYKDLEKFITYWGKDPEDTMRNFCRDILQISAEVYRVYCSKEPIAMTLEDEKKYRRATECYICKKEFNGSELKYRDHDHVTGKYLGATCNGCNFRRVLKNCDLPLIFHNAKGYDLHHIIKEITKKEYGCTFNGIAQNSEKIMSFTIKKYVDDILPSGKKSCAKAMCNIKIIDSLLFLLKSLESLTNILKRKHPTDLPMAFKILFTTMREHGYTDKQIETSLTKNIYPYIWFDNFEKFDLPIETLSQLVEDKKYECFTDTVDETYISTFEKKAEVFRSVLKEFPEFKTIKDYANLYLMCDVLQLVDIIVNARETFFASHKLDMLRYYGAPGYSWDAFLFQLHFKPELFKVTEMNMVCFFMQCIRGGCSGIMTRFAQANNKLIKGQYDPEKEETFILYLDANNLYGWSMMQKLPYAEFLWFTEHELAAFNEGGQTYTLMRISHMVAEGRGCFLEVKLEYPKELHDAHNLYPLAPERRCVKESEVSYFTRHLHEKLKVKINTKTPLLLQTLEDKDHYFVYYKNLQLYCQLGLKLVHVYGGIHFKEGYVMKDYIQLNTKLRNQPGASEFDKEMYKLMNNSIYGKTLENPMKYSILQFLSTQKQFFKAAGKPGFDGTVFTQDDFAIAKLKYETVKYEKPLYLGATITELAKWKMFNFYYNVIQDYFKGDKWAKLLFTDTDSLMLHIKTDNIYRDIAAINADPKYDCPIDVSSFDPKCVEAFKINTKNNKVIGAFKSETGSQQIVEFVGLRAKMYSYIVDGDRSAPHFKAKGVARSSLNMLSHQNYIKCLFNPDVPELARQPIKMKTIRSKKHNLMSIESEKFGLSTNDTKRYIIPSGEGKFIKTLAFGHYAIPTYESEQTLPTPPPPPLSPSSTRPSPLPSPPLAVDVNASKLASPAKKRGRKKKDNSN